MKDTGLSGDQLLAMYDRVAGADDAIPRLRRFVLDLAVRGKLVAQDTADEPASELLKRIEAEKARLVKAGELRSSKTSSVQMVAPQYSLPTSWRWAALGNVFVYDAGDKRNPNELSPDLWLLELEDVEKDTGRIIEKLPVSSRESKSTKSHFRAGDILYGKLRPYLNKVVVADRAGYSTTEIVAIRPYILLCPEYCALALRRPDFVEYVTRLGQGTKMPRLRTEDARVAPFPLPPLAEQHRIVAKVAELMGLLDQLEQTRARAEGVRARLTTATWARLTTDAADAPQNARHTDFALKTLPALTTTPTQIKTLRQTILNLAVRGELVAQDPDDEPASVLLKRIADEKADLIHRKEIRRKKEVAPVDRTNAPFPIPTSWEWCRLGNLFHLVTDGAHHTPRYIDEGVPFLSVKDVSSGRISFDDVRCISDEQHKELCGRCRPERGDILLTKVGTTGIAVPVDTSRSFSIFVSVALLKFSQQNLAQAYLTHLINSPFVRRQSADGTQGIGNQNLVLRIINEFALPIPPLAEQHRIVAKVDALLAICDELETVLTTTATTRARLLETLIRNALSPDVNLPEAAE